MSTWVSGLPVPNPSNSWTDAVITANVTKERMVHLTELRTFLEGTDEHYHIVDGASTTSNPPVPVSWTDTSITTSTKIRAVHWNELRTAAEALNNHTHVAKEITSSALSVPVSWPSGAITADVTKIRKAHVDEIRAACDTLYNHTHTVCCECECTCTCECQCTCTCQEECCSECFWGFD